MEAGVEARVESGGSAATSLQMRLLVPPTVSRDGGVVWLKMG